MVSAFSCDVGSTFISSAQADRNSKKRKAIRVLIVLIHEIGKRRISVVHDECLTVPIGWLSYFPLSSKDMYLIPYTTFSIETGLNRKQAMLNLMYEVKSTKTSMKIANHSEHTFRGELSGESFKISKILSYRNDMAPVILGTFADSSVGTEIKITMRMSRYSNVFIIVFLSILGSSLFNGLVNEEPFTSLLIPIFIFVFAILLTIIGFNIEATKVEILLMRIFDEENKRYQYFDS